MTAHAVRHWYLTLATPPGTPPRWLFAPVWAAVYVMIGTAGWLVWRRNGPRRTLRLWGWQLAANALWAPAFFGLHSPAVALGVMVVMLILIGLTVRAFRPVNRTAAGLMVPYGVWSLYGGYLNIGFLVLNQT